jgi:hypothetical protein
MIPQENLELKDKLFEGRDLSEIEMQHQLEALADKVFDENKYRRVLTKDEIDELKTVISDKSIAIKTKKEKLKEETEPVKKEIKKLEGERELAVTDLKKKSKEETGKMYEFKDFKTMTIHSYDRRGQRISVRPMNAEERQLVIKMKQDAIPAEKTGTND